MLSAITVINKLRSMKNAVLEGKPYEEAEAMQDHLAAKCPTCVVEIERVYKERINLE